MGRDPRIVYAGTPEFAVPALEALIAAGRIPVAVYTQPDRPAGRGRRLQPSAVKRVAEAAGIPVRQPVSLKAPEAQAELRRSAPDLLIVAAYGLILPASVLALPVHGGLNIHASLLPRWRGAAPIQRAILAGDSETGVCLMKMERGLDTGPVFACARLALGPEATSAGVHDQLAEMGARLLVERLDAILAGTLAPQPQSSDGVCYAQKIGKHEAWIDWSESAVAVDRKVRAFDPWPVAQTCLADRVIRVHRARPFPWPTDLPPAEPGTILGSHALGVDVATGAGMLRLLTVQMPSRKPVPASVWARGESLAHGRFGAAF